MTFPRRPHVRAGLRAGRITNGPANPLEAYERFVARTRPTARVRPASASWFQIRNAAESADVYVFDDIGEWGCTAQDLVDQLRAVTAPQINLHINSRGGSCFDGFAIYTCLKAHVARVHVYVDGLAASAASFIAMAGDRITIGRNAMMMVHKASGLCWGNAPDMRQMADLLDQLDRNISDIYSQRAGGTVESWLEVMAAETWYSGAEAVAAGLADEMTDPDPDPDAPEGMSNAWDLSVFTYAGRESAPAPAPVDRGPAGRGVEPAPVDRQTGGIVAAAEVPVVGESVPALVTPAGDLLGLTPEQRATSDVAAALADAFGAMSDAFVSITDATAPDQPADPDSGGGDQPAEEDDWAAAVAALDTDLWATLAARLTNPAPATEDDAFARLREACIE